MLYGMENQTSIYQFLAPAELAPGKDPTIPRTFSGVAYSGDVITDHGAFARVAFDLARLKFKTPAPLLSGHDQRTPVGVIKAADVGSDFVISGDLFSTIDDAAKGIAAKADAGFPWQMSVGIFPGKIEEIPAGTTIELNGRQMDGPLSVFRNSRVREVSFCALGADSQTSATVFTAEPLPTPEPILMETKPDDQKAVIEDLQAQLTSANAEAEDLKKQLKEFAAAKRKGEVVSLFSALGREVTEEFAAPYMDLTDVQFAAVSADLLAMKPKPAAHLFSAAPTGSSGEPTATAAELSLDLLNQLRGVK